MQQPPDPAARAGSTSRLLTCRCYPYNGCTVVAVAGEIDLATAASFQEALGEAIAAEPAGIVVDLSAVTFMDSTGMGALVRARRRADEHGRSVALVGATAGVRRILDLTGLDRVFVLHESLDDACLPDTSPVP